MRYYRYGNNIMQQEIEAEERRMDRMVTGRFGDLIIDEDTIYEIDEECLRCQQEQRP